MYRKVLFCPVFLFAFLFTGISSESRFRPDSLTRVIEKNGLSHASATYRQIAERIQRNGQRSGDLPFAEWSMYWRVLTDYLQGKSDTSLLSEICTLLDRKQDDEIFDQALLHLALSMSYTAASRYADAFRSGLTAFGMFGSLKNDYFMSESLYVLGNICTYLKIYKMAESYYDRALVLTPPGSFDYYQILLNKTKILSYTQSFSVATDSMSALIPDLEHYGDTGLLAVGYLNIATCFVMQDSFDQAGRYYGLALALSDKIDNNKLKFTLFQGLGSYYFYRGDIVRSFDYFYLSLQIAFQDGNSEELGYAFYNLGYLYETAGAVDSALFYMKRYIEVNARTVDYSGMIEAYRAYVSVALEASEDKLTIARQEIELKNKGLIVLAIVSVAIVLVGILLFAFFVQRKRQQALIRDMEKKELESRLENERKLKQLQTKRHKEKMEAKAREIASYSLLLSNKNRVLQQISSITERLPDALPEVSEIESIIKSNLNTDEAWENFMLHFQKIHPNFFHRLKTISYARKLTENELRLCAYFRIGMSAKQIAQVLNVSPESVRIHRYRLKKKFALAEEENLDDFIRNI